MFIYFVIIGPSVFFVTMEIYVTTRNKMAIDMNIKRPPLNSFHILMLDVE